MIAEADTKEEIEEHWRWIDEQLLPALGRFFSSFQTEISSMLLATIDVGVDVTDYVQSKIRSLCARVDESEIDGKTTNVFNVLQQSMFHRFRIGEVQECHEKIP